MDVNDVSNISSNLSSLNDISSNSQLVSKSNPQEVSSLDNKKDSLRLTITEYNKRRDELSASLQTFTQGIGIATVAQNALTKQTEYLSNIEKRLTDIQNNNTVNEDKNSYKNDLNKELLKFRDEAYQTKYKNEKLIALDEYEDRPTIEIDTKEAKYSFDKPNTPVVANQIAQTISSADLNDPQSLQGVIDTVGSGIDAMKQVKEEFSTLESNLKQNARDSIQEQINLSNQNLKNKELNFGKESDDFTKSNVMSNMGYLAASQANIVQEQSVRLLS